MEIQPNLRSEISSFPIRIWVGATYIALYADNQGYVAPGVTIGPYIRSHLQEREWVIPEGPNGIPLQGRWITTVNYTLREDNGLAHLPRYSLPSLIDYLGQNNVQLIPLPPVTPKITSIPMKKRFELRENQVKPIEFILREDTGFKPLNLPCASGKMQALDDVIKVPGGWKKFRDLKIGDRVLSPRGTYCHVTGLYPQGLQQLYRVLFYDGRYLDVGKEHLWKVLTAAPHGLTASSVQDTAYLEYRMRSKYTAQRTWIPLIEPDPGIECKLPLHPYVLGVLLGDGSFKWGSVVITTDKWIMEKVATLLPEGCRISDATSHDYQVDYVGEYRISGNGKINPVKRALEQMGIYGLGAYDKYIPNVYLRASYNQRLSLLQGLMDTDGGVNTPHSDGQYVRQTGHIEFSSSSERLANGVLSLIRSIGDIASIRERVTFYTYKGERKTGHNSWRIHVRAKQPTLLFTLPRKLAKLADKTQYSDRFKLRVEAVTPLLEKKECMCITVDDPEGLYVTKDYIVTHNTALSIAATSQLGGPAVVILPLLIQQWQDRIKQFTTLKQDDVYVLSGLNSIKTLWAAINHGYQPKIVLAAMRTLLMYAVERKGDYAELPTWTQLQEAIGFNVAIMDEVHMWFTTNVKIQLTLNIKHNIFLSATFARTDWRQDQIYQGIFPPELRYSLDKANKYTTTNVVQYSLGIYPDVVGKFNTHKFGYNHARYEAYLLRKPGYMNYFVDRVLLPLIQMYYIHYKRKGQKCLILNWTRAISEYFCKKIQKAYPNLKVKTYFSGTTPESNLQSADIIVSTHKSCGVGTDIKGLKTCINTVSFSSAVMAQQVLGRLREIPNEEVFFVDIWNNDIGTHAKHKFDRLRVYKQHSKVVYETKIT